MRIALFLAWAFVVTLFGGPAHAERRVALVVGNDRYVNLPADQQLQKAANDARAVGDALAQIGFEVIRGENLDRRALVDRLDDLTQRLAAGDTAFFFFAGHGVAIGGSNYILPADVPNVEVGQDTRLARAALGETDIVSDLQARGVRVAVVVLDACRNNPFRQPGVRGVGGERGLGRIEPVRGVFTIYSAGIGQTALDRLGDTDGNPNSVFTRVFVPELTKPGLDLQNLAGEVREEVARLAGSVHHDQRPAYYDETIGGRIYLAGLPKGDEAQTGVVQQAAPDPCAAAAEHWRGTEAVGTRAAYEDHIARFPTCAYVGLAQIQIERLKKAEVAMVVPPPPVAPPKPSGGCDGTVTASLSASTPCPLTAAAERALKPKDEFRECDKCPEMVVVPSGNFTMGSPPREIDRGSDEAQHPVTIGYPFAMGKFHVTVEQFAAFVTETGYRTGPKCETDEGNGWSPKDSRSWRNPGFDQGDTHPVVCVSWNEAKAYIAWLSKKTGKGYRLATEAEYEYAARGGTTTTFWWGSSISSSQANYDGTMRYGKGAKSEWRKRTVPEDSFEANPFGLHQVHGNASQWLEDCWHTSYRGAPADGSAWMGGDCSRHATRGGGWYYDPGQLRSAFRDRLDTDVRHSNVGIRVARTLVP
jgi:formylglycine-generating enzyme required for sulfatase activity